MNGAAKRACPQCGRRTQFFVSGDNMGWRCTACSWSAVCRNYEHPVFDRTLYTVWIDLRGQDLRYSSIQLAGILGMAGREVREVVERGDPIARDVPGGMVCHLHSRLSEAGVGVRVQPDFPWELDQPGRLSTGSLR